VYKLFVQNGLSIKAQWWERVAVAAKESETEAGRKRRRLISPIRELREEFGFSRESFARHINVSFSTLRAWEQGVTRPKPEGKRRLHNAFITEMMKKGIDRKKAALWVMERLVPVRRRDVKDL